MGGIHWETGQSATFRPGKWGYALLRRQQDEPGRYLQAQLDHGECAWLSRGDVNSVLEYAVGFPCLYSFDDLYVDREVVFKDFVAIVAEQLAFVEGRKP